jgi:hypothetical protein
VIKLRNVVHIGESRGIYFVFVGKSEGKRPLGRPRHRWDDSIKMDHQEVGCGGLNWINLAQNRGGWQAAGTCECSNEPLGSMKYREHLD